VRPLIHYTACWQITAAGLEDGNAEDRELDVFSKPFYAEKIMIATGTMPARRPDFEFDGEHIIDRWGPRWSDEALYAAPSPLTTTNHTHLACQGGKEGCCRAKADRGGTALACGSDDLLSGSLKKIPQELIVIGAGGSRGRIRPQPSLPRSLVGLTGLPFHVVGQV
jgi:hypothetical protein